MMRRLAVATGLSIVVAACDPNVVPTTSPSIETPPAPPTASPTPSPQQFADRPDLGDPTVIALNERVDGTVRPTDPACFVNWDSSEACRQYVLTAAAAGTLTVTLTWLAGPQMDLFVLRTPNGPAEWDAFSTVTIDVTTGQTLGVVVMSASLPQDFLLETTLKGGAIEPLDGR
jgi:hypothetical protein